jgi:hypothetical protein
MKNLQILIIVFFISLAIFALTNIQVHADGVTQPIKVTMSDSAPSATVTITDLTNPGAPSPSTFSSDGSVYLINGMSSGDSFTLSFSNDAGSTQDGFSVSSVFSSTSITYSVSGSELDVTAYEQVSNNFTVTGLSGADSVTLAGTYLGVDSSPIVILNTANDWNASAWSDYGYAVTFPASSASSTGTERWSIGSEYSTGALTAGGGSYSEAYVHQFYLTVTSAHGSPTESSQWVTAGTDFTVSVTAPDIVTSGSEQWNLTGLIVDSSPATLSNSATFNDVDAAYSVQFDWTHNFYITVTSTHGSPTESSQWVTAGSPFSVSVTSPDVVTAGQDEWVVSGPSTQSIASVSGPETLTFSWTLQYSLTMATNYGSTSPSVGVSWHDAGSGLDISATAPTAGSGEKYVWNGWTGIGSGNYTGTDNPTTGSAVTMNGPVNETASWTLQYSLTMATNYGSTSPSVGVSWHDAGSSLDITATAPTAGAGEKYVWNGWTGVGTGSYTGTDNPTTGNAITMNGPINETASWTHQYEVTFVVSPSGSGSTSPAGTNVWEDTGSLSISATANSGYSFSTWSSNTGSITFADANFADTTATINGPGNITATFTLTTTTTYSVTFTQTGLPAGKSWSATFNGVLLSSKTSTIVFRGIASGSYSWSVLTPIAGSTGIRYQASQASGTMSVPSQTTQTITYTTQYLVTFAQSGVGSDFSGTLVTIDGNNYAARALPALWWNSSSSHSFAFESPLVVTANGKQYVWASTTGLSTLQSTAFTVSAPGTINGHYQTQYWLTTSTNFGTVNPSSGWHNAGSTVTISATAPSTGSGERYLWHGWKGTGSGSYTGTNNPAIHAVTMNAAITETASWTHQYQVTVTASPTGAIGGTFAVTYTMSGTTYTHQQHNTPWTQWTDASTTVTVSSPQSPYKGYTFSSYTNNPATMNSAQTITLMYYGALNHFVFNTISTQTAGTAFRITITAKDAYGNTVTSYDSSTTLTETGGGAGGTVSISLVTFTNGVYTGNVYVTKSGTGVTITATHGSTRSASNTFTVNPGALSTFVFNTISTQTAGTAFRITITAKDAYGNTVTSYASSVGFSASTGIGTITPTSTGTSGWLNGVWSGSVTLTTTSSRVTITANDGSGHTGTSNPFIVRI